MFDFWSDAHGDPGFFVRFIGHKKALIKYLFYIGGPMVYFKESYNFPRGGPTVFRGGSNLFRGAEGGGSNCLSPIETHITCDFPGEGF